MLDKSCEPYILTGSFREVGEELIFQGLDGVGEIAFVKSEVHEGLEGVTIDPDVRPRLVTPPVSIEQNTVESTGTYCICIGPACYAYQCSDNTYLGQCGPVPCSYYGCQS